jgi:hypothetical protein
MEWSHSISYCVWRRTADFSTAAANAPPSVEMTFLWVGRERQMQQQDCIRLGLLGDRRMNGTNLVTVIRGHPGSHAACLAAVERFERKAREVQEV